MRNRFLVILLLILVPVTMFSLGFQRLLWTNKHKNIKITSDQVLVALEEAGYSIDDVIPISRTDPGPLGYTGEGVCFNVLEDDLSYRVCVVDTDGWQIAKSNAEISNDLDKRMGGYFSFAFIYGPVVINVGPPEDERGDTLNSEVGHGLNVALGKNIYKALDKADKN